MTTIKLKRVYDEYEKSDGLRVLVDKLWPRGIKKENLKYDLWTKNLAPSTELRKWFHSDTENNWKGFRESYIKELKNSETAANFIKDIQNRRTVTLLFAAKDLNHNHASILKDFLEEHLK